MGGAGDPRASDPRMARADDPRASDPRMARADDPRASDPRMARADDPRDGRPDNNGRSLPSNVDSRNKNTDLTYFPREAADDLPLEALDPLA